MNKISIWISVMRLRTLPLSVSGIILAACLAYKMNCFNGVIFVLSILTTLSFQILSNLANDYGDGVKGTDNKDRIGPKRAIQTGALSPKSLMMGIKINVLFSIILALSLVFFAFGTKYLYLILIFSLLTVVSIIAAIRYTVGSTAYGYRGLGDVFVFIFFGIVSVLGSYVLYAKTIAPITFLPAITVGLLSTAVLNLNNMRDILSDEKSKKITLVVKLGSKNAKIYHNMLIIFAIITSFLFGVLYFSSSYNLIYSIAYLPLLLHLNRVNKNKDARLLDPELKKVALTTVLLAVLMGLGQIL